MAQLIKVLCVDDNERWRKTVEEIVAPMGYTIEFASSSQEAMRNLKRSTFHVAILDKKLDDNDPNNEEGLSIAHVIAGLNEGTKIIVYTAYGDIEDAREAFRKIKVWDFIGKDRPIGEMVGAVKKAAEEAVIEQNRPSRMPVEILAAEGSSIEQFLSETISGSTLPDSKRVLDNFAKLLLGKLRPLLPDTKEAKLVSTGELLILQVRFWSKILGSPIAAFFGNAKSVEIWLENIQLGLDLRHTLGIKGRVSYPIFQETSLELSGVVFELENVELDEFETQIKFSS